MTYALTTAIFISITATALVLYWFGFWPSTLFAVLVGPATGGLAAYYDVNRP